MFLMIKLLIVYWTVRNSILVWSSKLLGENNLRYFQGKKYSHLGAETIRILFF